MSKNKEVTVGDFLSSFDHFRRVTGGNTVVIHPGLSYGFIELKETFVDELKRDLQIKISMAGNGIEPLSATTKFAIMLLEDAY